jgi:hypothetical protein
MDVEHQQLQRLQTPPLAVTQRRQWTSSTRHCRYAHGTSEVHTRACR